MLLFIMQIILFCTDCLFPNHNFTLHGLERRTNHFTIIIFYFRKSLHFDEIVNSVGRSLKTLHPRWLLLYDWKRIFADVIHCAGKEILLAQCAHLCYHGICNKRHVFVLPRYVKDTVNFYESIRCHWYIEDWSVTCTLSSVSHETIPYFLVKWGQDPYDLLM